MPQLYTASQMFDVVCKANDLVPDQHQSILTKLRYMAKRRILLNGTVLDERGTYAFPVIELFRAAINLELAGLAMDVRALEPVVAAAGRRHPDGLDVPESMKRDGAWTSRGGLWDAIHGVAQGEQWTLRVELKRPGRDREGGIAAAFVCDDIEHEKADSGLVDEILGQGPAWTRLTVDLTELFLPLIEIVGVPE